MKTPFVCEMPVAGPLPRGGSGLLLVCLVFLVGCSSSGARDEADVSPARATIHYRTQTLAGGQKRPALLIFETGEQKVADTSADEQIVFGQVTVQKMRHRLTPEEMGALLEGLTAIGFFQLPSDSIPGTPEDLAGRAIVVERDDGSGLLVRKSRFRGAKSGERLEHLKTFTRAERLLIELTQRGPRYELDQ